MESTVRIILGILLVSIASYHTECASLRSIRETKFPDNNTVTNLPQQEVVTLTTIPVTESSPSSAGDKPTVTTDKISKDTPEKNVNKIEPKVVDLAESESVRTSEEVTITPKNKTAFRGTVKFQPVTLQPTNEKKESQVVSKEEGKVVSKDSKENETDESKEVKEVVNKSDNKTNKHNDSSETKESKKEIVVTKIEEPKATGRSLNINIDKYVSAEFHNKNNVFSLPTSPEIEKYLEPNSDDFSEDSTKPILPKKSFTSRTTTSEYDTDLTTPQSDIFDSKFRSMVDGIKQNLDELSSRTEKEEKEKLGNSSTNYDISELIDNVNNADNDTVVALDTKEFKSIDMKSDNDKQNKDVESGKNINYESTRLESHSYGDNSDIPVLKDASKSDNETGETKTIETKTESTITTTKPSTTTFIPSKKPRFQVSLRNNTIETTAPDSEVKPKSIKHFTYESSSLDPLYDSDKPTYTKPVYENAINISKRGSTKLVGTSEDLNVSSTPSFMDFDNKNFTIPPTATAWTLVSLKDVPTTTETKVVDSTEQNSQENNLIKTQVTTSTTNEPSTTESGSKRSTKFYKISSSGPFETTTNNDFTDSFDTTTTDSTDKYGRTTESYDYSTTDFFNFSFPDEDDDEDDENDKTTFNFKSTIHDFVSSIKTTTDYTTTEFDYTTDSDFTSTVASETTTVEPEEYTTTTENYSTTEYVRSTESTTNIKPLPPKTESENELYTTIKTTADLVENTTTSNQIPENETTTQQQATTSKSQKITSTLSHIDEEDNSSEGDNDYSDITKKEKNSTDTNDPDIEMVPIDTETTRTTIKPINLDVTTEKQNDTTTPTNIHKEQKSVLSNSDNEIENTTTDSSSSTDMLSNDDVPEESNSGMIAAIAISSVGGVCLIILAGLLLIMRKRQKRVTYGQRCRPVSLDAYSLDNVSVYNSVRRKGALRASKRSYGNPAFDDPVSISHQMNFQSLVKFAENVEEINSEFDEIPQVTARANEVPPGCETKNRYANVIPLPETRVFLKPSDNDPHSDYINANYVTGPKNTRGYYIACQAPMSNTVDDFWRMVWEQQCRVILMLTTLYENGIEKCADYLPPSEVVDCHRLFGDFQITLKKREVKEKYIISSLQLKNMVSNSWREVTHLWYLGWPERGVPTEANSLIAFLIEARSHLKTASNNNSSSDKTSESCNMYISKASNSTVAPEGGPMVVHCSPGTGRTGTAIACDIAIRDFELTRAVDVPKIVYRVRRDRASAVQTRDQYAFIYKVISVYATKLTGGALDSI